MARRFSIALEDFDNDLPYQSTLKLEIQRESSVAISVKPVTSNILKKSGAVTFNPNDDISSVEKKYVITPTNKNSSNSSKADSNLEFERCLSSTTSISKLFPSLNINHDPEYDDKWGKSFDANLQSRKSSKSDYGPSILKTSDFLQRDPSGLSQRQPTHLNRNSKLNSNSSGGNGNGFQSPSKLGHLKSRIKTLKTAVIGFSSSTESDYTATIKEEFKRNENTVSNKNNKESKYIPKEIEYDNSSVKVSKPVRKNSISSDVNKPFINPKVVSPKANTTSNDKEIKGDIGEDPKENNYGKSLSHKSAKSSKMQLPPPMSQIPANMSFFSSKKSTPSNSNLLSRSKMYTEKLMNYLIGHGTDEKTEPVEWLQADETNFYQPTPGEPISVAMNVVVLNLADIDTAKMSYRMKLEIWVAWPLTKDEVRSYYENPDDWKPYIHPEPAPSTITIESSEKMKFLSGRTTQLFLWRGKFVACECTLVTATYHEYMELVNFPFDCQHFHFKIGIRSDCDLPCTVTEDGEIVFTNLNTIGGFSSLDGRAMASVSLDDRACYFNVKSHMLTLKDFTLEGIECEIENTGETNDTPFFHCALRMSRSYAFYVFRIFMPIFLIMISATLVFRFNANILDARLSYIVINMLTIVAFFFIISSILPLIPYLTLIDKYMNMALLYVVGIGVMCVLLHEFDLEGSSIENYVFTSLLSFLLVSHLVMLVLCSHIRRVEFYKTTLNRHEVDEKEASRILNAWCTQEKVDKGEEFIVHTDLHEYDSNYNVFEGCERVNTTSNELNENVTTRLGWLFDEVTRSEESKKSKDLFLSKNTQNFKSFRGLQNDSESNKMGKNMKISPVNNISEKYSKNDIVTAISSKAISPPTTKAARTSRRRMSGLGLVTPFFTLNSDSSKEGNNKYDPSENSKFGTLNHLFDSPSAIFENNNDGIDLSPCKVKIRRHSLLSSIFGSEKDDNNNNNNNNNKSFTQIDKPQANDHHPLDSSRSSVSQDSGNGSRGSILTSFTYQGRKKRNENRNSIMTEFM